MRTSGELPALFFLGSSILSRPGGWFPCRGPFSDHLQSVMSQSLADITSTALDQSQSKSKEDTGSLSPTVHSGPCCECSPGSTKSQMVLAIAPSRQLWTHMSLSSPTSGTYLCPGNSVTCRGRASSPGFTQAQEHGIPGAMSTQRVTSWHLSIKTSEGPGRPAHSGAVAGSPRAPATLCHGTEEGSAPR